MLLPTRMRRRESVRIDALATVLSRGGDDVDDIVE